MISKDGLANEASKQKHIQKLVYNCTAEAYRIANARFEDCNGLRSIFKRRGNQSGTVEAAQTALSDILLKEDLRKRSENDTVDLVKALELNDQLAKHILRMCSRIVSLTNKIKIIKFPFNCIDFQVHEIMNLNCSNLKVDEYCGVSKELEIKVEDIINDPDCAGGNIIPKGLVIYQPDQQQAKQKLDVIEEKPKSEDQIQKQETPSDLNNQQVEENLSNKDLNNLGEDQENFITTDKEESNNNQIIDNNEENDELFDTQIESKPSDCVNEDNKEQAILNELTNEITHGEDVKVWHVFKCILNTSRHVFEVEVSKYKAIIDKRKFFGQEDIEPILCVGKRGLLQNRKRNSQNNKQGNRSLTATESEVEKYFKKIKEHNSYIK